MSIKVSVPLTVSEILTLDKFINHIEATAFGNHYTDDDNPLICCPPSSAQYNKRQPWEEMQFQLSEYNSLIDKGITIVKMKGSRDTRTERFAFKFNGTEEVGVLIKFDDDEYNLIFPDQTEYEIISGRRSLYVIDKSEIFASKFQNSSFNEQKTSTSMNISIAWMIARMRIQERNLTDNTMNFENVIFSA
ncbi:hypothetical protein G9P44_003454 [Scheffersomyces stipitis]|nr:hypothetical protein G9P44_003454 [Scheffersomyces stipitis]